MNSTEQYYPTLQLTDRDVALSDFKESLKLAHSQSKFYGQVATILIALASFILTFLLKPDDNTELNVELIFAVFLGYIVLTYLIQIQKTIFFNMRKVVTLRSLLGLDYTNLRLIIPNWRVEGATNPFAIKMFPGWISVASVPVGTLVLLAIALWVKRTPEYVTIGPFSIHQSVFWISVILFYLGYFRTRLNDTHETFYLNIVNFLASLSRLKKLDNFEYIIYRAKLSVIELKRRKYEYSNLKTIIIAIEDQNFLDHRGFRWRSLGRAFLTRFKSYRQHKKYIMSGGSTITMQLMRTLFILTTQNRFKRKLFEVLYSRWFESKRLKKQGLITKDDILDMYVSSVRFHRGYNGLIEATMYFFEPFKTEYTNEEAFFLAERLQNLTNIANFERITNLYKRINANPLLKKNGIAIDESLLFRLYEQMIASGKLKQ